MGAARAGGAAGRPTRQPARPTSMRNLPKPTTNVTPDRMYMYDRTHQLGKMPAPIGAKCTILFPAAT